MGKGKGSSINIDFLQKEEEGGIQTAWTPPESATDYRHELCAT